MARSHGVHSIVVLLGFVACLCATWASAREGVATLLSSYASTANRIDAADEAARLDPSNADVHYVRASLLAEMGERAEAIKEHERAVALRPNDYVLWLELARARDQMNDVEGALSAFKESVRLAPFYAEPHWQFGNTLFRADRRDEAFAEMRRATISNPKLLPQVIDLAWAAFADPQAVEQALQPRTQSAHLVLASFFATHGKASESIAQFRAAGVLSNEQRRVLVADLLASKSFAEAFEVWSTGHSVNGNASSEGTATITNGGLEEPITLNDPGFDWHVVSNLQAVRISIDSTEHHTGNYSLRLDWSGESDPSTIVVSQLVLVEPKTRYRLSFSARTQEMLTIALPIVTVAEDISNGQRVLGQSRAFPEGTSGWQDYVIEFETHDTRAVRVAIRRQNCSMTPCAALGHAWVDDFTLEKL